ncbi:uncharacterized protein LOC130052525 [Ostrea edulis]|uniref:uncharacterized protein LOC130052525 n=1 Tax=Ostrea edulis TaxID=37623 RepID=UPI0024AF477D|nr:uncharacterized protein LOC130052525 [Ostrea edulis]
MDKELKKTRRSEKDNNDSFRKWLKQKRKQQKFDRKIERYRIAEEGHDHVIRSQEDCTRIFKAWLRKKDKDIRQEKEETERRLKLQAMVQKRKKEIEKMKLAHLHDKPFML